MQEKATPIGVAALCFLGFEYHAGGRAEGVGVDWQRVKCGGVERD